jgi:hypothetical protein
VQVGYGVLNGTGTWGWIALAKARTVIDHRARKVPNLARKVRQRLAAAFAAALEHNGWLSIAKALVG